MANDNLNDPNTVPGAEGNLPIAGESYTPPREDPAGVGTDRDGSDEAQGHDPLHPEQRHETINNSEHGPEDRAAGTLPNPAAVVDDPADLPDVTRQDPNNVNHQSAKRTDETDADQGTLPNEPANPEAHEGV